MVSETAPATGIEYDGLTPLLRLLWNIAERQAREAAAQRLTEQEPDGSEGRTAAA